MKLRMLPSLLLIVSGCTGAKSLAEPIKAGEQRTTPEIASIAVEWGNCISYLRQRIVVYSDRAIHEHVLKMPLQELETKYAEELSTRRSYTFHPIHVEALERNLTDSDFFELRDRYSDIPDARYLGHVNADGRTALGVRGGTLDGWVITITVTTKDGSGRTVALFNGSLNSFYVILRSIGNMDPELAELVAEPIGWMKAIVAEF